MIYEPKDLKENGYIKFTVPKDYHECRYGRIHKITDAAVYVVSWYDCFVGYEYLEVPYERILEYNDKVFGIVVEDDQFEEAIELHEDKTELQEEVSTHTRQHGKWLTSHPAEPAKEYKCTACQGLVCLPVFSIKCYYNYCPNCGAKMDEGEE